MANAFEEIKAEQAQADDQCAEFLEVYEAWIQEARAAAPDRARAYRLEKRVRMRWDALAEDKRALVVDTLVTKGYLPAMVRRVVEIFKGRVVEIV